MKGQVNIEFLAGATLFLAVAGTLLITGTEVLPGLSQQASTSSLYSEAYTVSTQMLSRPGSGNAVGLSTSADNYLVIDPDKLDRLTEFNPSAENTEKITYSEFKENNSVRNQYRFDFTWMPVVSTNGSIKRFNDGEIKRSSSDSMVGYWTMDETDPSSNPNVDDSSGDGNIGEPGGNVVENPEGDVVYNTPGTRGTSAFEFSEAGYFSVENGFSFDSATVSVWMRPEDLETQGKLRETVLNFSSTDGASWSLVKEDEAVYIRSGAGSKTSYYSTEIGSGWSLITVTIAPNGDYTMYLDGEQTASGASGPTLSDLGTEDLYVGAGDGATAEIDEEGYVGKIDNLRVYSAELSAEEVEDIYTGDEYTKSPVQKIVEPDEGGQDASRYENAANTVRYGRERLNKSYPHLLVTSHDGEYDEIYASRTWDFSDKDPLGVGQSFSLFSTRSFALASVSNAGNSRGGSVVLERDVKEFGPQVDDSSTVARLERFAAFRGEPMKAEVLVW